METPCKGLTNAPACLMGLNEVEFLRDGSMLGVSGFYSQIQGAFQLPGVALLLLSSILYSYFHSGPLVTLFPQRLISPDIP